MILPDVLQSNLKVVFCGTAAGTKSAQQGAYYAGPGNQFWPVLYRIGLTPHRFEPAQFWDVLTFSIGLTDLAQHTSGMDKVLKKADFDVKNFCQKMIHFQPKVIAFNGKRAASEFFGCSTANLHYGLQSCQLGISKIFVLPSTSSPARGFWDETQWQSLAAYLRNSEN